MSDENKALVRTFFERAYNAGDLTVVDQVIGPGYVGHIPQGQWMGAERVKTHIASDHAGWPDILLTIDDQIAEGDKVVTRWTWTGTHTGATGYIPVPTGKYSVCPGVTISRFVGGKIVEEWWVWDNLAWLEQLGLAARVKPG
jgi:predicted ester cyclase